MNELLPMGLEGKQLRVTYREHDLACESPRFDVIEPLGAEILGCIVNLDRQYPMVTMHKFCAGAAIYVGLPAREELLDPILNEIIDRLAIQTGPQVPEGIMARQINPTRILFLNLDGIAKRVTLKGRAYSILRDQEYEGGFILSLARSNQSF